MNLLEESVKAAKDQVQTKEEVVQRKTNELMKERDSELEASIKVLEKSAAQAEVSVGIIVDQLNNKVQESTIKCATVEEGRDTIMKQTTKQLNDPCMKISQLEAEFSKTKDDICSKDKLQY